MTGRYTNATIKRVSIAWHACKQAESWSYRDWYQLEEDVSKPLLLGPVLEALLELHDHIEVRGVDDLQRAEDGRHLCGRDPLGAFGHLALQWDQEKLPPRSREATRYIGELQKPIRSRESTTHL